MSDQRYNGWENKPTWLVNLWLENDESLYHYWLEAAREEADAYKLAKRLQDEIEDSNPLLDSADLYSDLIGWAIAHVNWDEVAKSWLAQVEEEQEASE